MDITTGLKEQIQEKYGAAARLAASGAKDASCCSGTSCCGAEEITENLYSDRERGTLPDTAVAASLVPKGSGPVPNTTNQAVAAARAEPGARPGAAVGSVTAKTVTIQDVNKSRNEVTFTGDDGIFRNVQIKNPDAQKFASTLKKGDQVDVTFSEAVAVSVEPAK